MIDNQERQLYSHALLLREGRQVQSQLLLTGTAQTTAGATTGGHSQQTLFDATRRDGKPAIEQDHGSFRLLELSAAGMLAQQP